MRQISSTSRLTWGDRQKPRRNLAAIGGPNRTAGAVQGGAMTATETPQPDLTDSPMLADVRERFLNAEPIEPSRVRDTILASWWRSRQWNVAADHIDLTYVRDPDLHTPLTRNALPALKHLREHLEGQPISVILTDAAGVVLSPLAAAQHLHRRLD